MSSASPRQSRATGSPNELGSAHANIVMAGLEGASPVDDAIVIFDDMHGGVRLPEPLLTWFPQILDRLRRAATMTGADCLLDASTIEKLARWFADLSPVSAQDCAPEMHPIFAPGSEFRASIGGTTVDCCITGHERMCIQGNEGLMSSYERANDGGTGWISHACLRPGSRRWSYLSNPPDREEEEGR